MSRILRRDHKSVSRLCDERCVMTQDEIDAADAYNSRKMDEYIDSDDFKEDEERHFEQLYSNLRGEP